MKKALLQHIKALHPISGLKLSHENNFQADQILVRTRIRNISIWPQFSTNALKLVCSELLY